MSLRKKKAKKAQASFAKGVMVLLVAFILLGGLLFLNFKSTKDIENTGKDFCRTDVLPEVTAILIDHTDIFSPLQRTALEKHLQETASGIRKNGMIQFYSVDSIRSSVLKPDFYLCNPGNEDDLENKVGKRLSTVKKNYEDKFTHILESGLDKVLQAGTAQESPIMESLQSVQVTSFTGLDRKAERRRLILVSDLLEHTNRLSFFKGVPDFNDFKASSVWQLVKSDLHDVDVEIFFLRRESAAKLQTTKLRDFWVSFFENQGATVTRFLPI
ncbi:MAG: hypothetical protein PW788_06060 [Micavibrio sp.]|nr:hypothetical protein [Micavibrio sp.]